MSKFQEVNKKIEDTVVGAYKKVEDTIVGAYKKVEDTDVEGYQKAEDNFVDTFIAKDGETTDECKERITR